ncbi:hypothetical protein BDI4_630142 [Burkholderia diffusa]|nr:hypothetical protein BDI4_630142 [Burkholderia diffusa]
MPDHGRISTGGDCHAGRFVVGRVVQDRVAPAVPVRRRRVGLRGAGRLAALSGRPSQAASAVRRGHGRLKAIRNIGRS